MAQPDEIVLGGRRASREPGSSIACVRTRSRGGTGADEVTGHSVAVAGARPMPRRRKPNL